MTVDSKRVMVVVKCNHYPIRRINAQIGDVTCCIVGDAGEEKENLIPSQRLFQDIGY